MKRETLSLPGGSPGSCSELTVWRYGTPGARPKIHIQAALHADEWPGVLMLHHLHHVLQQADIIGEIVIVPLANPLGLRQFLGGYQLGRFDFDYSGNFNRGFLELAQAALPYVDGENLRNATPEVQKGAVRAAFRKALENWPVLLEADQWRKALQLLVHDADALIDVHCDASACPHAFASKRQADVAEVLARCMDLPVLLLEDDLRSMAFDEAFAAPWWRLGEALGLDFGQTPFATTLELRGERDVDGALAAQDARNLLRFLQYLGAVAGDPAIVDAPPLATPLAGVARVNAPQSGLLQYYVQAGDSVEKGQILADLIDPLQPDAAPLRLTAPVAGVIYALGRNHMVRPGHVVAQIAGKEAQGRGVLAY